MSITSDFSLYIIAWPGGMTVLTFLWTDHTRMFASTMQDDCFDFWLCWVDVVLIVLNVIFSELIPRGGDCWPKSLPIYSSSTSTFTELTLVEKIEQIISTCVAYWLISMKWMGAGFHLCHSLLNKVRLNRPYCCVHLTVMCCHVSKCCHVLGLNKSIKNHCLINEAFFRK